MNTKQIGTGWLLVVCLVLGAFAEDKKTDPSRLTLERIYKSGDFGTKYVSARWEEDGDAYVILESSGSGDGGRDIVRVDADTGDKLVLVSASELIPPDRSEPLSVSDYAWSDDKALLLIYTNTKRVWRTNSRGDYWVLDRSSGELQQLGGDAPESSLMFAKFSPDGTSVAYVRDRAIYVENLIDRTISCVAKPKNEHIINGTFDWVYEEELGLRDGFRWSPDSQRIAYWQLDTQGVRRFPLINNTDGLYPTIQWIAYPKVGQKNSACRVGVVTLASGKTEWMDVPGDPRNHYIARMDWADSSEELCLQQFNRRQNTLRVMLANAKTGDTRTVLTETDDAWVDKHDDQHWIDGGKRFTWPSERDGWRHLYIVSRDGSETRLVTEGDFDVIRLLTVDEENRQIFFTASPDNPTQEFLYRVGFDGKGLKRVTPKRFGGAHGYNISPDGEWAIHSFSDINTPSRANLVKLAKHKLHRKLEENKEPRRAVRKLDLAPAELFRVDIGDGVELDGWIITPPQLDPNKKYPMLVYVYGEPAGQTVKDRWGGSSYLWHQMLAQNGFIVMSIDNRGTKSPRGRAFRKSIYGRIGDLPPQDQAAAVREVLKRRPYIDADRVGVWGWSGGGSSSLQAIFKYPKLFSTAIAVAPVPNQRYYDTIYQERYMGLPGDRPEQFRKGSTINFAKHLEGDLLLIHGTGDDNCHYATTEKLINELIRHNKQFSMMAYPNRSHSIREGKNTTIHLRTLMTNYLYDKMLNP
ncbi:MAG: S9 family peptidase [Planctomycetota bacterium]|jgi:dipeptidyl-peptidase-4